MAANRLYPTRLLSKQLSLPKEIQFGRAYTMHAKYSKLDGVARRLFHNKNLKNAGGGKKSCMS